METEVLSLERLNEEFDRVVEPAKEMTMSLKQHNTFRAHMGLPPVEGKDVEGYEELGYVRIVL